MLAFPKNVPIGAFRGLSWQVGQLDNPSTLLQPDEARSWLARFDMPRTVPTLAYLSYDLGAVLEPAAMLSRKPRKADRLWPLAVAASLHPSSDPVPPQRASSSLRNPAPITFRIGTPSSNTRQDAFEHAVERALEYIRGGDIYQVNLAHRFSAPFQGCPRAFFAAIADVADPAHGAYLEHADGDTALIVASASPELFLDYNAQARTLRTRPMKGTRAMPHAAAELLASAKDQAELAMIVDLMCNDLGKVCDLASVRVETPRQLETHGSHDAQLLQTTATIAGSLRTSALWPDILAATFPGGSITGAPKIRAMQIIEELETDRNATGARRGPYCGSVGLWNTDGSASLNIAIRTACITGTRTSGTASHIVDGTVDWWVGAGIVADSNPREEWAETLAKAAVFMRVLMQ